MQGMVKQSVFSFVSAPETPTGKWKTGSIVLVLFLLLASCQPKPEFAGYYELPDEKWLYSDSIRFSPVIADTSVSYRVVMEVEHARTYPFQNLYVRIGHPLQKDGGLQRDTFTTDILKRDGHFAGKCRGEYCRFRTVLFPEYHFSRADTQTFVLEQFTRTDSLAGIKQVGLLIEENKVK